MQKEDCLFAEVVDAELVTTKDGVDNRTDGGGNRELNWIENWLSPKILSWMMAIGGTLLVSGFAVWLWSIGVFENPLTMAAVVSGCNLAVLAAGVWLLKCSRYRLAGRGLTMLASLTLPLNLWLYESQGLLTLANGQLWIAALVCTIMYAVIARISRDHQFVYTLVGGVALTGTLFLAGAPNQLLWAALPVATYFVVLGILSIRIDPLFFSGEGDFSRDKFGLAFFRSGHVALAIGIVILFCRLWFAELVPIQHADLWTSLLLAVATLTYGFTRAEDRRHKLFHAMAIICGVGTILFLFQGLQIQLTLQSGTTALAALVLMANTYHRFVNYESTSQKWAHVIFASAFSVVLITMSAFNLATSSQFLFVDWHVVSHLVLASAVLISIPHRWNHGQNLVEVICIWGLSLAVMSSIIGAAFFSVPNAIAIHALITSVVAMMFLAFNREVIKSNLTAVIMLCTCAFWVFALTQGLVAFSAPVSMITVAIWMAILILDSYLTGYMDSMALCGLALVLNVLQVSHYLGWLNSYSIISSITFAGILISAASKMGRSSDETLNFDFISIGNSVICVGAGAACLYSLSCVFTATASIANLGLLAFQLISFAIAAGLTNEKSWRRGLLVAAAVVVGTGLFVHFHLTTLSVIERIEIGALSLGFLMVVVGHLGLARESLKPSQAVSFNLIVGSLLLTTPLAIGIMFDRIAAEPNLGIWRYLHEIGGFAAGLGLLGSGLLCRIRSTTLAGSSLLAVFVLGNLLLIDLPEQLQTTSSIMMIGGAAFFGSAVLMSIYRDRLLTIPQMIQSGDGVFRVFKWR